MGKIIVVSDKSIEESLRNVSRQYLVGNLSRPQDLDFIRSNDVEIGITDYKDYSYEPVHFHPETVEFQYVMSGWTKYLDTDSGEEFEFKKGDFYYIEKNTKYAQKSKKGTRILFIKIPSKNDKTLVEVSDIVKRWYDSGLTTVRKDYSHSTDMPKANSVRPSAAVAIIDNGSILMLKRKDNDLWTIPGGTMEMDESLVTCAVREMKEETSLEVEIKEIIGTYTDPDVRIEYSDGEVRREFTIVFYGVTSGRNIILDDESCDYKWVSLDDVMKYPMAKSQQLRVNDVIRYVRDGFKRIG